MNKLTGVLAISLSVMLAACSPPPSSALEKTEAPTSRPATVQATSTPGPTATATPDLSTIKGDTAWVITWQEKGGILRPVNLETGEDVMGVTPIGMGMAGERVVVPDASKIVVVVYPNNSAPTRGTLKVIDTQHWTSQEVDLKITGWVKQMIVSPDGRMVAVAYDAKSWYSEPMTSNVSLVDLTSLKTIATVTLENSVRQMAFAANGKALAVYTAYIDSQYTVSAANDQDLTPKAMLLDGRSLAIRWETSVPTKDGQYKLDATDMPDAMPFEGWQAATAFSADGTKLYVAHADSDKLTTVDFAAQTISTVDVAVADSWLDDLMAFGAGTAHAKVMKGTYLSGVLSADGSQMFVVGTRYDVKKKSDKSNDWDFITEGMGLKVIDVASGRITAYLDDVRSDSIGLSPDGSQLFVYGYTEASGTPWTHVLDAASLETIAEFDTLRVMPAKVGKKMLLLGTGSWTATTTIMAIIDPVTLKEITRYRVSGGWSDWVVTH